MPAKGSHRGSVACRVVVENCVLLNRGCMHEPRAEALFGAAVLSHLLGMFELNCLGVTVESPVEDMADELRTELKRAARSTDAAKTAELRAAKALLGLLGSMDMPCEVEPPLLSVACFTTLGPDHMLSTEPVHYLLGAGLSLSSLRVPGRDVVGWQGLPAWRGVSCGAHAGLRILRAAELPQS